MQVLKRVPKLKKLDGFPVVQEERDAAKAPQAPPRPTIFASPAPVPAST